AARPAPETRDDEASWVEYERLKLRYTETLLSRHGVGPWPSATSDDVTAAETALDVHVHAMAALETREPDGWAVRSGPLPVVRRMRPCPIVFGTRDEATDWIGTDEVRRARFQAVPVYLGAPAPG